MPVPPKDFLHLLSEVIPFNKFLGISVDDATEGHVVLRLPYRAELIGDASRPALHGGVISTLIDTAGGFAVWTQLAGIEDRVSTIDLRVDYLAPGAPEALLAEATIIRVGNRVGVVDVRCWQPSQPARTVATGKAVYNIKRKEDAP
ncbi:MAG TPA: PaaI family thioesterase [Polyangia bacterium]